jgi:hypothetical protein
MYLTKPTGPTRPNVDENQDEACGHWRESIEAVEASRKQGISSGKMAKK